MTINYTQLVKKSLRLAWKNKLLWLFGLFVTAGVEGVGYTDMNLDLTERVSELAKGSYVLFSVITLILAVAWFLLLVVFQAAIIKGIENSANNIPNKLKQLWLFGLAKFKKVLIIDLIIGGATLIVLSPILLRMLDSLWVTIVLIAWFLCVLTALIIFGNYFYYVFSFAVLEDKSVKNSFLLGWRLFVENRKISIVSSVLRFGLSIVFGLIVSLLVYILAVLFVPLGILAFRFLGVPGTIFLAFAGAAVIMIAVLFCRSYINVFYYFYTIYIFFELRGKSVLVEKKLT